MTDTEKIATEILTEMYSEADPPLDFQGVIDGDIDVDESSSDSSSRTDSEVSLKVAENWYTQHVLDGDRQREIVNEYLDKYELTNREKAGITMTCILDYGPTTPNDGENE